MKSIFSYSKVKKNRFPKASYISRKHGGIIAEGVAHAQKNNIGDNGIPVVPINSYLKSGGRYLKEEKKVEVESEEIVFNKETSDGINRLVNEYNDCKCSGKIFSLGQIIMEAVRNLVDETCRTDCKFEPKLSKIR